MCSNLDILQSSRNAPRGLRGYRLLVSPELCTFILECCPVIAPLVSGLREELVTIQALSGTNVTCHFASTFRSSHPSAKMTSWPWARVNAWAEGPSAEQSEKPEEVQHKPTIQICLWDGVYQGIINVRDSCWGFSHKFPCPQPYLPSDRESWCGQVALS